MRAEHDARKNAPAQSIDVLSPLEDVLENDFETALLQVLRQE
ncbi:MAG TPA: hypothetical protein VIG29_16720 [Vicinamibacteria bacterium]|jgi:hypothetical protein